ncbi:CRISPR-associated endonuclease Cas2 [Leucothrix arctica]|uniref:CRISPR-associated endoribonuclease Cas2 n=1 Tax=Leucothrix arctica TaxID=1481894 RepID=A0A317CL87_9GAMM|nr:CRISPR-associated endonuclease Cas2 [Leucothrix arctica]PWQ99335.1 CRISPR-associated endonuclease Cas2 [Leucothrix arctica]
MSKTKVTPYLIAYDIADPRRLKRVHRILKNNAIAMQKSVFITVMNRADCLGLVDELEAVINPKEDDIRFYPLPQKPQWYAWGNTLWPDGLVGVLSSKS